MANVEIRVGKKNAVFFAANPTLILKDGQFLFNSDTLALFIGDGVTQLSALVAINALTPTLQEVTDEGNTTTTRMKANGFDARDGSLNEVASLDETFLYVTKSDLSANLFEVDRVNDTVKKLGVDVATLNDIGTNYSQSFTYTGAAYTLTVAPVFIYSIRTTTMILDENDTNDVKIVGTTLTVTNPNFLSGETLYIKYKA